MQNTDDGRKDAPVSFATPFLGTAYSEASGLLLLWSLLVINEGAIRFMNLISETGGLIQPLNLDIGGRYGEELGPAFGFLFFASLFEVLFGFIGLFLGIAGFIFRFHNTVVVKGCMVIQAILGLFVFVIYVFLAPAFYAANSLHYETLDLERGLFRFLVALGILTSIHFCFALQGGQFVFMARMVSIAGRTNFLMQKTGDRMRAVFWSGNIALSGLWTLVIGAVIRGKIGGGKVSRPYAFPPHVGRLPGFTIATGIFMLMYGLAGAVLASVAVVAPQLYYIAGTLIFLLAWINFTIGQLSLVGSLGGPVAMHTGLVFVVFFLGTYFVWCASKEEPASEVVDEKELEA